ncbi:hypothetical protein [Demequina oxidasica]|uniref:hypothetical protein n=1 Tax=Demequina oxidasica TaxID=676199 RepID=UPI00078349F7|nr:hypothetical protein [Demequina oxidasica]
MTTNPTPAGDLEPESHADQETAEARVYRTALRRTGLGLLALAIIAIVVGALVAGGRGVVAGLVGVGVSALAGLTTQAAMSWGHKRSTDQMTMAVAGSWLLKMVIIVAALLILQNIESFHKQLFAIFAVSGVLLTLAVDFWVLRASRVPYVIPGSK